MIVDQRTLKTYQGQVLRRTSCRIISPPPPQTNDHLPTKVLRNKACAAPSSPLFTQVIEQRYTYQTAWTWSLTLGMSFRAFKKSITFWRLLPSPCSKPWLSCRTNLPFSFAMIAVLIFDMPAVKWDTLWWRTSFRSGFWEDGTVASQLPWRRSIHW